METLTQRRRLFWMTSALGVTPCPRHTALTRTDIYGSGRDNLNFAYFYEVNVELSGELREAFRPLRKASLGGSYSFGEHFSGWRVRVGYDF